MVPRACRWSTSTRPHCWGAHLGCLKNMLWEEPGGYHLHLLLIVCSTAEPPGPALRNAPYSATRLGGHPNNPDISRPAGYYGGGPVDGGSLDKGSEKRRAKKRVETSSSSAGQSESLCVSSLCGVWTLNPNGSLRSTHRNPKLVPPSPGSVASDGVEPRLSRPNRSRQAHVTYVRHTPSNIGEGRRHKWKQLMIVQPTYDDTWAL